MKKEENESTNRLSELEKFASTFNSHDQALLLKKLQTTQLSPFLVHKTMSKKRRETVATPSHKFSEQDIESEAEEIYIPADAENKDTHTSYQKYVLDKKGSFVEDNSASQDLQ